MKKVIFLVAATFIFTGLFAKPKAAPMPDWVQNYRTVYPNKEYLVQRGSGATAESARTDAAAALSRYFQTTVNGNLSTTMSSVTNGNSVDETISVLDEVAIQTQVDFFGMEFTEPYYYKAEKKWYCVVYINRVDAWEQYQPQIDITKNTFNSLYKKLLAESDYFTRLGMCIKAWNSGKDYLEKLEYGRIIYPRGEAAYAEDREKISEIPVIFEDAKANCSIFINADGDYNRIIETAVSTAFNNSGFGIEKTAAGANYTAKVEIENNVSGSDPLSIKPGINIKIINKQNKTVFSLEVMAEEKAVGYTLESAQKKAYPKVSQVLNDAIKEKLSSIYKL